MARRKYNHKSKIKNREPAYVKSVRSGMIIEFNYRGENIFDRTPLGLVLFNEYWTQRSLGKSVLIHCINLNYLNSAALKKFINQLDTVGNTKEEIGITIEDPKDELETVPGKGLLRETYTRITLPEFKQDFGAFISLTRGEARVKMDRIYEKIIKKYLLTKYDAYRTYKVKNMKNIRVVLFEFK